MKEDIIVKIERDLGLDPLYLAQKELELGDYPDEL